MELVGHQTAVPPPPVRRAHRATALGFFATGLVSATWAARLPAVQERLDLAPGELAVAVTALEAGAVLGLPAGGALATRLGSRGALTLGSAVFAPALVAAAAAPALGVLAACLALWAAANSVIDVALNAQGIALEHRAGRPLLSGLHAAHSLGLLAGGLAAVAAAAAGLGLPAHAAGVAALALTGTLAGARRLLADPPAPGRLLARPERGLLLLGAVAFCAFLVDGAASNWAAIALRSEQGASPATAAAGFTAFALALALGRLAGDRLVLRLGRVGALRAAGGVAAAGAVLVVAAPTPAPALLGWAVVGAGLAVVAPVVLGAAPAASSAAPGAAVAGVTTVGYLGSFTGPPLIGALAGAIGLSLALAPLVASAALIALLARRALAPAP